MSVKVRVSYEKEVELDGVLALLSPGIKKIKKSQNEEGRYKKAYVEMLNLNYNGALSKQKNL